MRIAWAWVAGASLTVVAALIGVALFYLGERTPAENFAIGDLGSIHTASVPRVVGFFLNANLFCNYLVVGLMFTLGLLGWRRPAGVALVGAIGVALAFTLSPGLGGAVVAVVLWLLVSERGWPARVRGFVVVGGVVGVIGFLVLTVTVGPRGHTWVDAIDTLWTHPLLGVGPGLPVASTTYNGRFFADAHNAWLNVAGQAGLLGLLALVGVVAAVCVLAWKARPIADVPEPVRAGWCAFVGAVLYGSLSISLEQSRHVWVLLGFLAAGLSAARRRPDRDADVRAGCDRYPVDVPAGTTGVVGHGAATSSADASRSSVASSPRRATNCTPIGSPLPSTPAGTLIAGWPVVLNTPVNALNADAFTIVSGRRRVDPTELRARGSTAWA